MYEPFNELSNYEQLRRFCPKRKNVAKRRVESIDAFPIETDCVYAPKIDGVSGVMQVDRLDGLMFKATIVLETLATFWFGILDAKDVLDYSNAVYQVELVSSSIVVVDWLEVDNLKLRVDPNFYLSFRDQPILKTVISTGYILKCQEYLRDHSLLNSEFPCDGTIAVVFRGIKASYNRVKLYDTIELAARSDTVLEDSDCNTYTKVNTFDLVPGLVYECRFQSAFHNVVVLKSRVDRIYPNSRLRAAQAYQHEQVRVSHMQISQ
ncbi:hypothetical protein HDE_04240 [Halotydeus destructor]|nr:hypothetical protein HDE_04240 [Halotydeus destructor]